MPAPIFVLASALPGPAVARGCRKVSSSTKDQLWRLERPSGVGEAGERVGDGNGEPDGWMDVEVDMPSTSRSAVGWDGRRRCVPSISVRVYYVDDAQSSLMLLIAQNSTCMWRVARGMYHQKVTEHKATSTSRSAKTRLIPAKLVLEHRLLVSVTSKTSNNIGHAYLVHCFVVHIARHEGSLRQLVLVCVPDQSDNHEVV